MDWLNNYIWPAENQFTHDFVYDGTALAVAEMIRGGTTAGIDTYFYPNASSSAYIDLGFRAQVSMPVIQFPRHGHPVRTNILPKPSRCTANSWTTSMTTALAPHAPYTVSDEGFEKIVAKADELQVPIHLHLHETATSG